MAWMLLRGRAISCITRSFVECIFASYGRQQKGISIIKALKWHQFGGGGDGPICGARRQLLNPSSGCSGAVAERGDPPLTSTAAARRRPDYIQSDPNSHREWNNHPSNIDTR